ncbi:DUF1318 domain-containing protein [Candidatus Omnitrophota bacterium]
MRVLLAILLVLGLTGCVKVGVETAKPIQVDINMRVDVYQHVVNDVDSINDEIYGSDDTSWNFLFAIQEAYAADRSEAAQAAISRRKERIKSLTSYFKQGYIGIDRNALVKVISDVGADVAGEVNALVKAENKDRTIMQKEVADKNEAGLSGVQKVFFEDEYKRAPKGFTFEVYDAAKDKYVWQVK